MQTHDQKPTSQISYKIEGGQFLIDLTWNAPTLRQITNNS